MPAVEKSKSGSGTVAGKPPARPLKIQSPEIRRWFMKFNSKLPTRWPLVPSPDQDCFAGNLVDEVDDFHFLPNYKSLRDNCQAALRTNVLCEAFRAQRTSSLGPLNRHGDPGIQPPGATNMFPPLFKFDVFYERHLNLPRADLHRGLGFAPQFPPGGLP